MLADAGLSYIEVGSFVSPKWVPSMADSKDVVTALNTAEWREQNANADHHHRANVVLSCLVPNVKGLETALEIGSGDAVDEIAIFASASEAFSQKVCMPICAPSPS